MRFHLICIGFLFFSANALLAQVPNPTAGSGYCIDFDGSGDYVQIPVNPALHIVGAISVEAWIYCRNAYQWESFFAYAVDNGGNESGYDFGFAGGKLRFRVATVGMPSDDWNNDPGITLPLNQWAHVAGTYDGTTIKVYLNGVLQEQRARTGDIDWGFTPLEGRIGCYYDSNEEWFWNGKIDELKIWNIALSDAQIKAGMCRKSPPGAPNIVAYYRLDEASGVAVQDLSSNMISAFYVSGTREFSGAALGDISATFYPPSWTGVTLQINTTSRGSVTLNNISGSAEGLHLYNVSSVPNTIAGIDMASGERDNYWGVYIANGNLSFTGRYDYTGYPFAMAQENLLSVFERMDNTGPLWVSNPGWIQNLPGNMFMKTGINGRREWICAADRCPQILASAISGTNCSGTSCQVCPNQNIGLSVTNGTDLPAGGQIKWYLSTNPSFDPYKSEGSLILSTLIGNGNPYPISGQFALGSGACGDVYYIKGIISPYPDTDPFADNGSNCETSESTAVTQTFTLEVQCPEGNFSGILCIGDEITIGNTTFDEFNPTGQTTIAGAATGGCDSLVNVNITFVPATLEYVNMTLCAGENLIIQGTVFDASNPSGQVIFPGQGANNCDSIVDVQLQFYPVIDTTFLSILTCDPNAVDILQHLTSGNGCDSIVLQQVIFLGTDSVFIQGQSCVPADTGVFIQHLMNQNGCDSVVVESIVLSPSINTFLQTFSCLAADTGIQIVILPSSLGCDSIVQTTTSLLPTDSILIQISSCNPLDTGLVTTILMNQFSCDSVIQTYTAWLQSDLTELFTGSCNPLDSGWSQMVLINQNGCDSLVRTYTQLYPSDIVSINLSSCNPADTGFFTQVLSNQFGCDSVVNTSIVLSDADSVFIESGTCVALDTGQFVALYVNQFGCDSVVISHLSLLPSSGTQLDAYSCNPADTGWTQQVLVNQFNCDSIVSTHTQLLRSDSIFQYMSSCNPADTGIQIIPLINALGCDSIVILKVNFALGDTTQISLGSCFPADTGFQMQHLQNQFGCDSLIVLHTELLPSDLINENSVSCNALDTGRFVRQFVNQFGCDSLIVSQIALSPWSISLPDTVYIKAGDSVFLKPLISADLPALFSWVPDNELACANCSETWVSPLTDTEYTVSMSHQDGCLAEASVFIKILKEYKPDIFIPNGFSPDGDGVNDGFTIYGDPAAFQHIELRIFNRWGDLVYETPNLILNEESLGWDGNFRGKKASSGVYVYVTTLKRTDGTTSILSGSLTVK